MMHSRFGTGENAVLRVTADGNTFNNQRESELAVHWRKMRPSNLFRHRKQPPDPIFTRQFDPQGAAKGFLSSTSANQGPILRQLADGHPSDEQ